MYKISDAIREILDDDLIAKTALVNDYLNSSEYARQIKPLLDSKLVKDVDVRTISTTLTRLGHSISQKERLLSRPVVHLRNLTIHSDLVDITYEKTNENLKNLLKLTRSFEENLTNFFSYTKSIHEITMITDIRFLAEIRAEFSGNQPTFVKENLTGLTAVFSDDYLTVPNFLFELGKPLAARNVNIVEIISTTTEITYILEREDLSRAIAALDQFLVN